MHGGDSLMVEIVVWMRCWVDVESGRVGYEYSL